MTRISSNTNRLNRENKSGSFIFRHVLATCFKTLGKYGKSQSEHEKEKQFLVPLLPGREGTLEQCCQNGGCRWRTSFLWSAWKRQRVKGNDAEGLRTSLNGKDPHNPS